MAERRMFAKSIITSDAFIDMPVTARLLYYDLGMRADDDGRVHNCMAIIRSLCLDKDDLEPLLKRGYIQEKNGIYTITDWKINNGIGENSKKRNSYAYRKWRSQVILRDGKCVKCGSSKNLQVHHIKRFSTHPELQLDIANGITLCEKCHKSIHEEDRKNGWRKVD